MAAAPDSRDAAPDASPSATVRIDVLIASGRPLVMGVVNVTPNSFSDGGQFAEMDAAVAHGLRLVAEGADIVDVGGEATNPRAEPVSAAAELARVLPVIERLAAAGAIVSVDTTKAVVARAAVAAGAAIVNDVSGGLFDPAMPDAIGDAVYVAGHLRGRSIAEVFAPEARGELPPDWRAVADELSSRLDALAPAARARAWIDPGLGFGKGSDPEGNLALIRHAGDLARALGRPVVIGPSRKRFLKALLATSPRSADGAPMLASVRRGDNAAVALASAGRGDDPALASARRSGDAAVALVSAGRLDDAAVMLASARRSDDAAVALVSAARFDDARAVLASARRSNDAAGVLASARRADDAAVALASALGAEEGVARGASNVAHVTVSDAERLALDVASVAACLGAVQFGARIVRTHNVALLAAALAVYTRL